MPRSKRLVRTSDRLTAEHSGAASSISSIAENVPLKSLPALQEMELELSIMRNDGRLSLQVGLAITTVISSLPAVTGPADEWRWLTEGVDVTSAYALLADCR